MKDVIERPVNPFTGKRIDNGERTSHPQYIFDSGLNNVYENNGNQFLPGKWYAVQDDMRNPNNWKSLSEKETVLPLVENEAGGMR